MVLRKDGKARFTYVSLIILIVLSVHFSSFGLISAEPTLLYSFVHLTDTQTLSEKYPETLNSTFQYLEQVKSVYNIKRIIVTGDLVQHWNRISEWQNFINAMTLTSIDVDCLGGNHDSAYGRNFTYYNRYIGADRQVYFKIMGEFLFIYVSWLNQANTLNQTTLTYLNSILNSHQSSIPVFATHYYSRGESTEYKLSSLGQQLLNLTRVPTIMLMGHVHGTWANVRNVRGQPVYEFNTNYQDANKGYVRIFKVYNDATVRVEEIRVKPEPAATTSTFTFSYLVTTASFSGVKSTSSPITSVGSNSQATINTRDLAYVIVVIAVTLLITALIANKRLKKLLDSL
jgi:hypothetical protein